MLDNITINKMKTLKLQGMLDAFEHIQHNEALQTLTFSEGLAMLIDREANHRDNKRLQRLTRLAKLRYPQAMVEDINQQHQRAIHAEQMKWLVSGQWLTNHQNILLIGPTGMGKTYLACAAAQLACRMGYNTRYFRMAKLFEMIRVAQADGTYPKLIASLLKTQCLVLDDWGIDNISTERRADLLEIIDDAYERRSVIIATQLPVEHWHEYIGDSTIADAILDRIIHNAKQFNLQGESMRKILEPF